MCGIQTCFAHANSRITDISNSDEDFERVLLVCFANTAFHIALYLGLALFPVAENQRTAENLTSTRRHVRNAPGKAQILLVAPEHRWPGRNACLRQ